MTPDGFAGTNALLAPDLWLPLGVYSQLGSAFSDTSGKMELTAPKELHTQSGRPDASRPNDRFDQVASACLGQTTDRDSAARIRPARVSCKSRRHRVLASAQRRRMTARSGSSASCCSRWPERSCSSPASTWPTCSWRAGRIAPKKSRSGSRSGRVAGASSDSCLCEGMLLALARRCARLVDQSLEQRSSSWIVRQTSSAR